MIEKILRKIVAPVIIPAVMFVAGCKVEKPVKEDYFNKEFTSLDIRGISSPYFRDFDKDGKIDSVLDGLSVNYPLYIAEGYERYYKDHELIRAEKMTPEMRAAVSKISEGINELNYEIAGKRYEEDIKRKKR